MEENIKIIELNFVNVYLLKTDKGFVLIDTGLPMHWPRLDKELMEAGCVPGALKVVVLTHGDFDHSGNATRLREKYGVRIALHGGDISEVEKSVFLKRKVRPVAQRVMFSVMMFIRKLQLGRMKMPAFTPDIVLSDGQSLEEFGLMAKVIHLPGHTPGSMGILTERGSLFAGDTFVNRKKPDTATIIENQEQFERRLNKVKSMNVRMVYPGHGKPFAMTEKKL